MAKQPAEFTQHGSCNPTIATSPRVRDLAESS
jgi:hypothetical protein